MNQDAYSHLLRAARDARDYLDTILQGQQENGNVDVEMLSIWTELNFAIRSVEERGEGLFWLDPFPRGTEKEGIR